MHKKISNLIKRFFTSKRKLELNRIKKQLYFLYNYADDLQELPTPKQYGLTKVDFNGTDIIINCTYPGILIGKGGCSINELKEWINKLLDKNYNITVREYNPLKYDIAFEI